MGGHGAEHAHIRRLPTGHEGSARRSSLWLGEPRPRRPRLRRWLGIVRLGRNAADHAADRPRSMNAGGERCATTPAQTFNASLRSSLDQRPRTTRIGLLYAINISSGDFFTMARARKYALFRSLPAIGVTRRQSHV